jgi:hypothetical protein
VSHALQRLVDARSIEPFAAHDDEIVGRWRVAVGAFHDARRVQTVEMRVSVCYQAGLQAAITLVRNAGYRVRSAPGGHHYVAFATLSALDEPALSRVGEEMNRLRRRRHDAVYDWREPGEADELNPEQLERVVSELLAIGYGVLVRSRPAVAAVLARP